MLIVNFIPFRYEIKKKSETAMRMQKKNKKNSSSSSTGSGRSNDSNQVIKVII
jgi:hypothetical protein